MHRQGAASLLCGVLILTLGASASAQIQVLVDFDDLVADPPWVSPVLAAYTTEGTTLYAILRGTITKSPDEWGSQIVRVEHIDATPVNTVLVSNAQWKAFTGADQWGTIGAPNHIAIIGDYLQYVDWFAYAVYRVHKTTGALSVFLSNDAIHEFVGLPPETLARPRSETSFSCERKMAMYESNSDNLLLVDDTGQLSVLISDAQFQALYGYKPIEHVSGGIAFDSACNLYWTLSQTGSTGSAGGCIYKRRASDGLLIRVLSQEDIQAVTGVAGNVAFNDIFVAPDGNVYFYDRRDNVDSILYFDPDDPLGTLTVYVTEAQIRSGPWGDREVNVSALNAYESLLTWHHIEAWSDVYATPLAGSLVSRADFDGDADVDLTDFGHFQSCFNGPNRPAAGAGCCDADLDRDADVDLADFGIFQGCFNGPNRPPACQ
jgi:hypothetical protein